MPRFQIRRRRPPVEKKEEEKVEDRGDEAHKPVDEVLSEQIKQLKVQPESQNFQPERKEVQKDFRVRSDPVDIPQRPRMTERQPRFEQAPR